MKSSKSVKSVFHFTIDGYQINSRKVFGKKKSEAAGSLAREFRLPRPHTNGLLRCVAKLLKILSIVNMLLALRGSVWTVVFGGIILRRVLVEVQQIEQKLNL